MKKKIGFIIAFILVITLIVGFMIIKFYPLGKTTYLTPNSSITLDIPVFSIFQEECCMYSVTFKSFRSTSSLKRELNSIMRDYTQMICNNQTFYYNEKEDITITDYGVNSGTFMNSFYITYEKGKRDKNECSVITDPTKMDYQMKECTSGICYGTNLFHYKHEDGNIYELYYENSRFLLFKTGMDKMTYFDSLLHHAWMSMQDIIDYLDYQSQQGTFDKSTSKDNKATIYKNKDFTLIECRTDKNKTVYIGNPDMTYQENYCK